jgi:hypothetical protein
MRDHRPTSTEQLIQSAGFSKIQQHAQKIAQANLAISSILAPNVAKMCRVANIRGGYLLIEASSAAIKMKLDYDRLYLLSQLRSQGFANLMSIEIKVNPGLYLNEKTTEIKEESKTRKHAVSDVAADYLRMVAQDAPDKIKKRLENIANLAKNK